MKHPFEENSEQRRRQPLFFLRYNKNHVIQQRVLSAASSQQNDTPETKDTLFSSSLYSFLSSLTAGIMPGMMAYRVIKTAGGTGLAAGGTRGVLCCPEPSGGKGDLLCPLPGSGKLLV